MLQFCGLWDESQPRTTITALLPRLTIILLGTEEINRGYALLMTDNKPEETALSLFFISRGIVLMSFLLCVL